MKIEVTEKDIRKGRKNCTGLKCPMGICPVALALQRTFRTTARVGTKFARVGDQHQQYKLPEKVQKFIKRFDQERDVKPLSFTLKIRKEKENPCPKQWNS